MEEAVVPYLNPAQRERVEQLARAKAVTCKVCGLSDYLYSSGTANIHLGGNVSIAMECDNEEAHFKGYGAGQRLVLSMHEAMGVGIDMRPRGRPETTG